MTNKTALVIRHVDFEDLGSMAPPLQKAGYWIEYVDSAEADLTTIDPLAADILVVLGGPIGVYDAASYPVITTETRILKSRMAANMPTMGICLGAQLMAHALGSRVYPGQGKEIGWFPLALSAAGNKSPLRHLEGHAVLHWHGDTFDLPEHCELLASTDICRNQAFARGSRLLGLQFHPEVMGAKFESWLMGHACELSAAKINPQVLRAETLIYSKRLEQAADLMFSEFLVAIK